MKSMQNCEKCGKSEYDFSDDLQKSYVTIFKNCLNCDRMRQMNQEISEQQLAARERLAMEENLHKNFNI